MAPIVDFKLSDREFERLRALVRQHTAIELSDAKRQLVYSRFSRRLRALGLETFTEYCDLVESDENGELRELANAITTNFTRFFREPHHFEFLADLVRSTDPGRPLRIWSAGCATGEEPYSIAITLLEALDDAASRDIKILATDVDTSALASASSGIFSEERTLDLDAGVRKRWFLRGRGQFEKRARISPEAQKLVVFRELNFFSDWPMRKHFDVIFCRNVMIYFALESKKALVSRFAEYQDQGSHLVVGHSENLLNISDLYSQVGNTVYRRR